MDGVNVISRNPIFDQRGSFDRLFCQETLNEVLFDKKIKQINRSITNQIGTVRGLHFQRPPSEEIKVVTCLRGAIFDLVLDIRESSSTFLDYHAEILTENNKKSILIPAGFAHGFQTLSANCELLYFHTAEYDANLEDGLNATDPFLKIQWPIAIKNQSERDIGFDMLNSGFKGVKI